MGKIIFTKNENKVQNNIRAIADDQATIDLFDNYTSEIYDIVDISSAEYQDIKLLKKFIVSESNGTFSYLDNVVFTSNVTHTVESCKSEQVRIISILDKWLANAPANALKTKVQNYRTAVNNIDFDTLFSNAEFTFSGTIENYIHEQGGTPVNILELL